MCFDHRLTIVFGFAFGYSLLISSWIKIQKVLRMCLLVILLFCLLHRHRRLLLLLMSARRSCPRCGHRMSSLQFDKHTLCIVYRDIKCSLDTRCKECKAWSKEFMLGYVKHQRSLVSKAKKSTLSSPWPPVTAVTTAPSVSLSSITFSEDRSRQLMHSMFQDLMYSARLTLINLLQLHWQYLIRPLSIERLLGP